MGSTLLSYTKLGDRVLVVALVLVSAALFFAVPRFLGNGGSEIEVKIGDRVVGRYSLSEDRIVDVQGPLGITRVEIKQQQARIVASPCPNKTCTCMGAVSRDGGVVMCVPNEVLLRSAKPREDGIDAVTR